jgi:hypothetical protein
MYSAHGGERKGDKSDYLYFVGISGGLSQFSFDENGTVPFGNLN